MSIDLSVHNAIQNKILDCFDSRGTKIRFRQKINMTFESVNCKKRDNSKKRLLNTFEDAKFAAQKGSVSSCYTPFRRTGRTP
jgi:hypothetical protein